MGKVEKPHHEIYLKYKSRGQSKFSNLKKITAHNIKEKGRGVGSPSLFCLEKKYY